ncbi:hypothetical protein HKX42_01080 [Salinisphaera sp. USBA-960]|uniref:phosphatidylserine decarboxylase n=1 Tax=Salinisphaera orenii TaxID=856731 RepID=UPI000DBE19D7|nr:hypothetical protein [Salifodinibacter halophilus]NNC25471.1 hypothetical protein [Salifodinibacter halophilus]
MQRKTLFRIVPEGWIVLAALLALLVLIQSFLSIWWVLPLAILIAGVAAYCHDTPRHVPAEPLAVVAPVDGRVIETGRAEDPFLNRAAIRISIRVSWWSTYLMRSPVEGTVLELAGEVVAREGAVASWIRTDEGDELIMAVVRGSLFGCHPCRGDYGERVGQGRCCGTRRLSRRVDLYLPLGTRADVEPGMRVRAGASVLAKLVHKQRRARPAATPAAVAGAAG